MSAKTWRSSHTSMVPDLSLSNATNASRHASISLPDRGIPEFFLVGVGQQGNTCIHAMFRFWGGLTGRSKILLIAFELQGLLITSNICFPSCINRVKIRRLHLIHWHRLLLPLHLSYRSSRHHHHADISIGCLFSRSTVAGSSCINGTHSTHP